MQVHRTVVDGVLLLVPAPTADHGGDVTSGAEVARRHGVDPTRFRPETRHRSTRGALHGLHGRVGAGEATLVRCAQGALFDVVVDARPSSPTFGRTACFLLDDTDGRLLHVPAGCLHGFQAVSGTVDARYRTDTPHDPAEEVTVRFDDPDLAVRWPLPAGPTGARDQHAGTWSEFCALLGVPIPERRCAVGW